MRSVNILVIGILLATGAPCVLAQAPGTGGANSAQPGKKPATHSPTGGGAKSKVKTSAAKSASKPAKAGENPGSTEVKYARRDPFESLVSRQQSGAQKNLPPGKAGLQVSTLRLDGIVRSSNGMIAVVSNPQARTYFLREGDQLYDGRVDKIAMDGVSFHEVGKDAFGKPVERQVSKRIYASAGEQQ